MSFTPYTFAHNNPATMEPGPDGNLWISTSSDFVVQMTPSGSVTVFDYSTSSFIGDIIAGPDGNMWAYEYYFGPQNVYKIATDGTLLDTYNLGGYYPGSMASDGTDLWIGYVPGSGPNVQKFDTSGSVLGSYTLVGAGRLISACLGPDGDMWFSDLDSGGVWKVTLGGVGTFYPLVGSEPLGICSDGTDLWVADSASGGGVWKVTTAGVATNYPVASVNMQNICFNSGDGNLYATDGNNLYVITTGGSVGPALPITNGSITAATAFGLAVLDGDVWISSNETSGGLGVAWKYVYTAPGQNKIVMLV